MADNYMIESSSFGAQKGGEETIDPHEAFRQNQQTQTAEKLGLLEQNAERINKALADVIAGKEEGIAVVSNQPTKLRNFAHPGPLQDLWTTVFQTTEGDNVSNGKFKSGLSALQIFLKNRYGGALEAYRQGDPDYGGPGADTTVVIRRRERVAV